MKLFLLSTILLAFPVTLTDARGDSRPFGAKASKTKSSKSQHGAFDTKSSKSISKTTSTVNGTKLTPIDEGRHSKNSENDGLVVVDGTEGAGGSEGSEEGDDRVTNDIFDDDYSPSSSSASEGFDPATAMFEWLTKCAAADLDKDTCLVAKTLDYLIDYSSQDDDTTHMPSKRLRALQQEEGCRPELTQQDLRNAMNGARADCNRVSVVYSDEHFDRLFYEFWTVISSDSCWEELCESPDIFSKLMFDHLVQCANVDFDVDQCITDHIFSKMLGETDSNEDDDNYYRGGGPNDDHYGDGGHDDGVTSSNPNHRFLRSLEDLITDCVEDNEFELEFFASFILMEAEGRCAEMGVSVTSEDVSRASADFVTLFSSPLCWGNDHACTEDDGINAD